jgi:formate dehydrogenase subunit beta
MIFHLVRAFHQAGRCSSCGACARACPMGVDLRLLTRKIALDVEELFGSVPDFSAEGSRPLTVFREDDSEEFLSEP